jgi:uncharacterized protein (DUF302 family)
VRLPHPYDTSLVAVINALKVEGFGVLSQIDVHTTLKDQLNLDFREYTILGACNPTLTYRALTQDAVTGLMLPCNITVESDESGGAIVRIVNPEVMLMVGSLVSNEELRSIAREARIKLERIAESLLIN